MRFRGVALIVPVVGTFSLFASPVAHSMATVPASTHTLRWLTALPGVREASRWSVFGGPAPPAGWLLYSVATCALASLVRAALFRGLGFADVISTSGQFEVGRRRPRSVMPLDRCRLRRH